MNVPAAPSEKRLAAVDELVAVMTPGDFAGVGQWYEDFSQTGDEEVRDLWNEPVNSQI